MPVMPATLWRQNCYDGCDEYYVLVKETGQHAEEESQEEIRRKRGMLEAPMFAHIFIYEHLSVIQEEHHTPTQKVNYNARTTDAHHCESVLFFMYPLLSERLQASDAPKISADFALLKGHADRVKAEQEEPKENGKPQESQNMEASNQCAMCSKHSCLIYILYILGGGASLSTYHSWFPTQCQTKNAVQKFLDSLLQKGGKLRGLIRDLKEEYQHSPTMQTQGSYISAFGCRE